jgi:glucokinase
MVMQRATNALAHACVSLNHIFNSDMFLFGGGVVEACGDFMLPVIEKALKNDPFFKRLKTPRVVRAKLGDDAVMLGAVAMAKRSLGEKIEGKYKIYPLLRYKSPDKITTEKEVLEDIFYVRADGKIKRPKDIFAGKISENDLEEVCRKSPDILIIAKGTTRPLITPKGLKLLKKKNITLHILPSQQAVTLFNHLDERKTLLSFP